MKIFMLIFALLASLYGAKIDEFAKKANYERDYETALIKAKKENKMIMLLVVADYCPWCKKFEKKTLLNSSIKTIVNNNFIPLVIDKIKEKGKYPAEYASPLIPAVFFIDPKTEKSVHKTIAYMTKKEYKKNMDEAIKLFMKKSN